MLHFEKTLSNLWPIHHIWVCVPVLCRMKLVHDFMRAVATFNKLPMEKTKMFVCILCIRTRETCGTPYQAHTAKNAEEGQGK